MIWNEREMLIRCKAGDLEAFRELVEQYRPYAFSIAFRLLGHTEDARDTVQESFIRVWKHLHILKTDMKFTTWLYRIVVNRCLDRIKAKKRFVAFAAEFKDDPSGSAETRNVEREEENKELVRVIERLAMDLPPRQRMVFVLRDLEDLGVDEVASILKMSGAAVKSNLYHARKAIRFRIQKLEMKENR